MKNPANKILTEIPNATHYPATCRFCKGNGARYCEHCRGTGTELLPVNSWGRVIKTVLFLFIFVVLAVVAVAWIFGSAKPY